MSRNLPRFLLIFSLALNVGFLIFFLLPHVFGPGPFPPGPHRGMVADVLEGLDLSEQDEAAMKELVLAFEERVHTIEDAIRQARLESLKVLAEPGPLDEEAIRLGNEKLRALYDQRFDIFLEHVRATEALLGPEVRARFHAAMLEHIKKDSRGPGGGG